MTQKRILYTGCYCSSWAWRKGEVCSLLSTRIYLKWSNYWDGCWTFICTKSLRLHIHRSGWGGMLYKWVSVLQHSVLWPLFASPVPHPFSVPPWLQDTVPAVEPVWPAALGQPGVQLPGIQGPSSCLQLRCPQQPRHSPEESSQCRKTGTIFMQSHNLSSNTTKVDFQPESLLNI